MKYTSHLYDMLFNDVSETGVTGTALKYRLRDEASMPYPPLGCYIVTGTSSEIGLDCLLCTFVCGAL